MNTNGFDLIEQYLDDIKNIPILKKEEEIELFKRLKENDLKAKEQLILSNLKLVVTIAKKYTYSSISLQDLIQEGNIALFIAIDKFDVDKGFKFSTFATICITQRIKKFILENETSIRLPENIYFKQIKLYNSELNFYKYNSRYPTNAELASLLNITEEEVDYLKKCKYKYTSINLKIPDSDDELCEFIPDDSNLEEDVLLSSLSTELKNFFELANLTDDEIKIITYRFGLGTNEPLSLEKISKITKKSKGKIKIIENKALLKLKKSSFKNLIKNYYEENDNDEIIKKKTID